MSLFNPNDFEEEEVVDIEVLEAHQRFVNKKTVAYKTVDTFAGITKKRLWLKDGPKGTDGNEIRVPFQSGDFYRDVEEMLAHILFRTDPAARDIFTEEYAKKVSAVAKKKGVEIPAPVFQAPLKYMISLLEAHRVLNLWSRLYEGSYEDMRRIRKEKTESLVTHQHEGILNYMTVAATNADALQPGELDSMLPAIQEALRKVEGLGFAATLAVSKWLTMQMVNQLIREAQQPEETPQQGQGGGGGPGGGGSGDPDPKDDSDASQEEQEASAPQGQSSDQEQDGDEGTQPWKQPPPPEASGEERTQALKDLIEKMGKVPKNLPEPVEKSKLASKENPKAQNTASTALDAPINSDEALDQALRHTAAEMNDVLEQARKAMRQIPNEDAWLQKDAMAKVKFIDAKVQGIDRLKPEDAITVARLRSMFYRVMGVRKATLEDDGAEVDISAYIERRLSRTAVPCFRHEGKGRGFRAMLLLDRSGSMDPLKTEQCERAARIIRQAMNFPFVTVEVWGFTSLDSGEVLLSRFDKKDKIDLHRSPGFGGLTPIHVAMRVAGRKLEEGTEAKQLFVLTDGFPSYRTRDGKHMNTKQLMMFVRNEVRDIRKLGTNVTGMLVGALRGKDHIHYDVDAKDLRFMFGSQKSWKQVRPDRLGNDLVDLVARSFTEYLKTR